MLVSKVLDQDEQYGKLSQLYYVPLQVLALINASNNSCSPTIIEYIEFYNMALDHMDLMKVIKHG